MRAEKDKDDTVRANLYDKFEYISNTVKWSSLRNLNPKVDQQIDDKSKLTNQQLIDMVKNLRTLIDDEEEELKDASKEKDDQP